MYYCLYKVINVVNSRYYYGVHRTEDLNDGYLGSGTALKRAIKKYGAANFRKEVLETFSTPEDMFAREREIISEDMLSDPLCMNIKPGGDGGWDVVNRLPPNQRPNHRDTDFRRYWGKIGVQNALITRRKKNQEDPHFFRRCTKSASAESWSEEATKKRLTTYREIGHQQGSNNSQYGTCWIHNTTDQTNKKIKRSDLEEWIAAGWTPGRKCIS